MPVSYKIENNVVTITVNENIDAKVAAQLESAMRCTLGEAPTFVFDFDGVHSICSLGFRALLMVRGHVTSKPKLVNANIDVIKTFELTSLDELFDVERTYREFSLDGCKLISAGLCGECWRINDETVIKLYNEGTPLEWIRREKAYAREAFIAGVPTVISYDMVKCGERYGILFELVDAKTMATTCAENTDNIPLYAHELATLALKVHSTQMGGRRVPDYIELRRPFVKQMTWLTLRQRNKLTNIMNDIPLSDTLVHGDFHANNVMMSAVEGPLLIDMGDLALGSPFFDLSRVYNLYAREYSTDLPEKVTKLNKYDRFKFWKYFVKYYFDDDDPIFLKRLENELKKYACISLLSIVNYFPETFEDNKAFMIETIETTKLKKKPPVKPHSSF